MRPFIGIEGPIGVGKTTLAQLLAERLQAEAMFEVYEENPFLAKFYTDPDCYALSTQLFFLMSRYQQYEAVGETEQVLVGDYIFAKNDLFADYTLKGAEHKLYQQISTSLAKHLLRPTLVVYLRADLDTLMTRIARRARPYEQADSMRPYMANLIDQYEGFFGHYDEAPLLTLDTHNVNIVEDADARDEMLDDIMSVFHDLIAERPTQVPMFQGIA
ncbi:MAG: deoxynucleoside kinase [Phototrophicaceae bacterium]|jgi:deoxyadenosine/deoxycytidine kinase